jgi:hypothetical protein
VVSRIAIWATKAFAILIVATSAAAQMPNKVVGTWRPVSATVEMSGTKSFPYGPDPQGKLIFTSDMHFAELLHDPRIPRFKSIQRGEGTDAENRAAMAGSVALYGRYTINAEGNFSGNTVEGSSFPNWIGDKRTTEVLTMVVEGDRMTENFQRPGGAKVTIVWERIPPR